MGAVSRVPFLSQPTHLWRRGAPGDGHLDATSTSGPAICSCFRSTVSPRLSYCRLFSNQVRSNRGRLSVTAIGCEISEGRACGNRSIGCAHLARHLYRHATLSEKVRKASQRADQRLLFKQCHYFIFLLFLLFLFSVHGAAVGARGWGWELCSCKQK